MPGLTFQEDPEKNANTNGFQDPHRAESAALWPRKREAEIRTSGVLQCVLFAPHTTSTSLNKGIKKYLKGQCPNRRLSCIGKYARNAISYKVSMDELRLFYL